MVLMMVSPGSGPRFAGASAPHLGQRSRPGGTAVPQVRQRTRPPGRGPSESGTGIAYPPRPDNRPRLSAVASDGAGGGADVATAELDGVHDERGDLVEGDAVLPAVGQRRGGAVGIERGGPEAPEEAHHG